MRTLVAWTAAIQVLMVALPARAAGVVCLRAEENSVLADGVTTDWQDVERLELSSRRDLLRAASWDGPADLSARVACQYTDDHVYFLVRVRDEYVVRLKQPERPQDEIRFQFGTGETVIFRPSDGRLPAQWGLVTRHRRRLRFVRIPGVAAVLFRLPDGYGLELDVPADKLPGYRPGGVALNLRVQVADVDSKASARLEAVMATSRAGFRFQEADLLLKRFLQEVRLPASQLKLNVVANFVTGSALERAVLVGRYLAVMGGDVTGGGWYYVRLPVARFSDVLRFAVRDMDGDGQPEILLRIRQRGGVKEREVFLVYRYLDTGGLRVIFGHEVVHKMPGRLLTNTYRYIRHGRGYDMEFRVGRCVGFTKANHRAVPPKDVEGILTPWGDIQKIRYRFTQEGYRAVP